MSSVYLFDGDAVRPLDAPPGARRLRWAAWRPDGAEALLVANRGQVWRLRVGDGGAPEYEPLATGTSHNLRGVGWSPDGRRALLAGNRGALLLFDAASSAFTEVASPVTENLRRVAWSPDGASALVVGNGGCVVRYDAAAGTALQVPGDRAHTLRSIAWRPDGRYALVGGYASRYAGYPRPAALYRCDGRFVSTVYAGDDDDDALAVEWSGRRATILFAAYSSRGVRNKLARYDGSRLNIAYLDAPHPLLGLAVTGEGLLLCGERGVLLRMAEDGKPSPVETGTQDNLIGPFMRPGSRTALLLRGPDEKVYTV